MTKFALVLLAALFPVTSLAEGLYLMLGVGGSYAQEADDSADHAIRDLAGLGVSITNSSVDDNDTAAAIAVGGHLRANWMAELG